MNKVIKMNENQKDRLAYIRKTLEVQEPFKEKSQDRKVELLKIRHELAMEILKLRDLISGKRFQERKALLKRSVSSETTMY